ncbi:MAG: Gfo/Idh/MocA family oxidoreductase, partial [Candidatus Latescibacteria bacterium]|nr:Gfo/Idh/MocA family oxidoreductase [Candidatus Latescibacterota bacterium]
DLMIHGEKGSIQVKDGNLSRWVIENEDKDAEKAEEAQMMATYGPKDQRDESVANDPFAFSWRGHLLMFEDMVGAIREDRDPINTGESARHAVEIINALYESCRQGKPIKLNPKY